VCAACPTPRLILKGFEPHPFPGDNIYDTFPTRIWPDTTRCQQKLSSLVSVTPEKLPYCLALHLWHHLIHSTQYQACNYPWTTPPTPTPHRWIHPQDLNCHVCWTITKPSLPQWPNAKNRFSILYKSYKPFCQLNKTGNVHISNIVACSCNQCYSGKAISSTWSECVPVAIGI
jgi:hypothetical protein